MKNFHILSKLNEKLKNGDSLASNKIVFKDILMDMKESFKKILDESTKQYVDLISTPPNIEEICNRVVAFLDRKDYTSITQRELRYVASYTKFYVNERILQEFNKCILRRSVDPRLCDCILSVWVRNFSNLTPLKKSIYEILSNYINYVLNNLQSKGRPPTSRLQLLNNNLNIYFAKNPPNEIADYIFNQGPTIITDEIKTFLLGFIGDLYEESILEIVRCKIDLINKDILQDILQDNNLSRETLSRILSFLIETYNNRNIDHIDLVDYILTYRRDDKIFFGDVRFLLYQSNWYHVDKNARDVFKKWRIAHDVELFFDAIFEDKNSDQRRKIFWLRYVGSMINVTFFLNESHISLVSSEIKMQYRALSGGNSSIFIMEFEYFYIVVASHSGDLALRIYSKDYTINKHTFKDFIDPNLKKPISMAELRNDGALDLKDKPYLQINTLKKMKITQEANSWRKTMEKFLQDNGVRPDSN